MQSKVLTAALIALSVLCWAGCASSRKATEAASSRFQVQSSSTSEATKSITRFQETGDSLREEISQNLNQNLTEHEVVTWTVVQPQGDTVRVERVTNRTRESGSRFNVQGSRVEVRTEVVHDTVYIERKDSLEVQEIAGRARNEGSSLIPQPSSLHLTLKWIVAIIIALTGLIITAKVCTLKR